MTISVGTKLPEVELLRIGENGPENVTVASLSTKGKTVIFGLPGAFTPTCHQVHLPCFIKHKPAFVAKGVGTIICIAVNDPFVMREWGVETGATAAGITMLADPTSNFTTAMGLNFDAPPVGLYGRSKRFSAIIEDGIVQKIEVEEGPGANGISSCEAILDAV